ncbi:P-II family nitrogen regulator [Lentibacillus amyloliquefaciens]|uniref:PII family protein n=1 Tax=Lentibacillus amyloliquefaciens TaxID=1472767 RepID=A0A0U4E9U2_9BACI|nr:P-II family nitrogen regulator [Lentibacillus amyloliquefaciens]ALX49665.1 PII family protein [Lentibacillus amyloliquefaciens]
MSVTIQGQKLIITIVKKDKAKKVVQASRNAGAQGGTTLLGEGIRLNEKMRILGMPVERERAVILTLVSDEIFNDVRQAIVNSVQLNKPRHGIGFVIDTKKIAGINHLLGWHGEEGDAEDEEGADIMWQDQDVLYDLIITIVNRGDSEKVVDATRKAGAEGGTILHGRGTGVHEKAKLFNIMIEPEKEVVLTLIHKEKTKEVLKTINEDAELKKPGKGIAFVLDVESTVGISRELNEKVREEFKKQKKKKREK